MQYIGQYVKRISYAYERINTNDNLLGRSLNGNYSYQLKHSYARLKHQGSNSDNDKCYCTKGYYLNYYYCNYQRGVVGQRQFGLTRSKGYYTNYYPTKAIPDNP